MKLLVLFVGTRLADGFLCCAQVYYIRGMRDGMRCDIPVEDQGPRTARASLPVEADRRRKAGRGTAKTPRWRRASSTSSHLWHLQNLTVDRQWSTLTMSNHIGARARCSSFEVFELEDLEAFAIEVRDSGFGTRGMWVTTVSEDRVASLVGVLIRR